MSLSTAIKGLIILDTNFFGAYVNKRDKNHARAKTLMTEILASKYGIRFSLSEVFSETATLVFRRTKSVESVKRVWKLFYNDELAILDVIHVQKRHVHLEWNLFRS